MRYEGQHILHSMVLASGPFLHFFFGGAEEQGAGCRTLTFRTYMHACEIIFGVFPVVWKSNLVAGGWV